MNRYKELALAFISEEHDKAISKFPAFHNAHEGYAVLLEEMDELWDAVRLNQKTPDRPERLENEAIQVGAMALRFIIDCCLTQNSQQIGTIESKEVGNP